MLWLASVGAAHAAPFTERAAFDTAVAGLTSPSVNTLDFEALAAGDTIASGATVGGFTFSYDFGGKQILVDNLFDTTSPVNYIGIELDTGPDIIEGDGSFAGGRSFTVTFAAPVNAFGISVIGTPGDVLAGDFTLSTAAGDASNAGTPDQTLGDGGEVFFLGIVDAATTFSSATLSSFGDPTDPAQIFFFWTADDLVTATAGQVQPPGAPEPASLALLGRGFGLAGLARRRRARA